jgi:hypothetical protein
MCAARRSADHFFGHLGLLKPKDNCLNAEVSKDALPLRPFAKTSRVLCVKPDLACAERESI